MSEIEQFFKDCAAADICYQKTVFVFPSQIPADLWMNRLIASHVCKTIPSESFISWDNFKESTVKRDKPGLKPVSSIIRKLYTDWEISENIKAAKNGNPLFSELIPKDYVLESRSFSKWLSGLLPQLGTLERYEKKAAGKSKNLVPASSQPEDTDLKKLTERYEAFLRNHLLFEPAWELSSFKDTDKQYYILFPHTIDDFAEYEYALNGLKTVTLKEFGSVKDTNLLIYENTRQEIFATVAKIRSLVRDESVPMSDIAVSVPDLENIAPYLTREFFLYDIPFLFRSGNPLGTAPGGVMFSQIKECVDSKFSFETVKALLLNKQIPWKNRRLCEAVIERGIQYHCVTSWNENGIYVDIWKKALLAAAQTPADENLSMWFLGLKKCLTELTNSVTFEEIRKQYFKFKREYIDESAFSIDCDRVISRCVEELSSLIAIESDFADICPQSKYSFFVSLLQDKQYVAQNTSFGVSIFPYKVAAGIPVKHHFILNAGQEQSTVIYNMLQFLRADRRRNLDISDDYDASIAFFDAYAAGTDPSCLSMSCSLQTMTGYSKPHSIFANRIEYVKYQYEPDSFEQEQCIFYVEKTADSCTSFYVPESLYRVEKEGFSKYSTRQNNTRVDAAVKSLLPYKQFLLPYFSSGYIMSGSEVKISATSLNVFAECPQKWYYSTLLHLKEFNLDSELIDDRYTGTITHLALKLLFERIKQSDSLGCFYKSKVQDYLKMIPDSIHDAFKQQMEFCGPLAEPLLDSLYSTISEMLECVIKSDEKYSDGLYICMLEKQLNIHSDGIHFNGYLDRVFVAASGDAVIIDYKTGALPSIKSCFDDTALQKFQMPMYVYLAEESSDSPIQNSKIDTAGFYGIGSDCKSVIVIKGDLAGKKDEKYDRDQFERVITAFKEKAVHMRDDVNNCNFTITSKEPGYDICSKCTYKMICRQLYAVK